MRISFLLAGLTALAAAQENIQVGPDYVRFPVTVQNPTQAPAEASKRQNSVDLTKQESGTSYTIQLQFGTPPQNVVVQLDTGSTDLWVNPNCANAGSATQQAFCNSLPHYTASQSTTYRSGGPTYTLRYGIGNATVTYVQDTVRAGSAALAGQTFGVASNSYQLPFGILGIGPYITGNYQYSFFIDSLKAQGFTQSRAFSLDLRSIDSAVGSIIFGGLDTGKYTGALEKLPIAPSTDGAARYWVNLASVSIGTTVLTTSPLTVLLDSGSTLSYLPAYLHTAIGTNFPTAQLDPGGSGYYIVSCDVANQPGSVDFKFGGKTIKVAYKDIIWFVGSNVCVIGTRPTSGIYILGDSFLRAAYVVFDQDQQNIHLAQAANCGTNLVAIGTGPNAVPSIVGGC
ncbi:acid protease, partial [Thozetella sp. PMI_491]